MNFQQLNLVPFASSQNEVLLADLPYFSTYQIVGQIILGELDHTIVPGKLDFIGTLLYQDGRTQNDGASNLVGSLGITSELTNSLLSGSITVTFSGSYKIRLDWPRVSDKVSSWSKNLDKANSWALTPDSSSTYSITEHP